MNLLLSLTERCNLRCDYCYYNESHAGRILDMTDEILRKSISIALDRTVELSHSFFNITFFGGEPLLRMDSIRLGVKYAKSLVRKRKTELPKDFTLRFAINTNATLLTHEILDYFEKEKFQIFLSLDGPERKHNLSRIKANGKGSFRDIKPYLDRLAAMDSVIISVVTRKHVHGLSNAIQWMVKRGFKKISTSVDFDGKWTGVDMDALALEYQKIALFWLRLRQDDSPVYLGMIQDKISYQVLGLREREVSCSIFKGGIGVAANGNVFPCSRFISSKPNAKYVLGNVLDNVGRIFDGRVSKEICRYLKQDKPECKGCAIRYRCAAHECGCTSFYTTGSIYGVSPEVCTHERILASICDDAIAKRQAAGYLY